MEIKVKGNHTLINSKSLQVKFNFDSSLENRLNNFYGIGGPLQKYVDSQFMNQIKPYMPFKTGNLLNLMTINTVIGQGENVTKAPQARFLYYGKLMVDSETGSAFAKLGNTKVLTDTDLKYHGGGNAGPFWDERWASSNMPAFTKQIQEFINRGGR